MASCPLCTICAVLEVRIVYTPVCGFETEVVVEELDEVVPQALRITESPAAPKIVLRVKYSSYSVLLYLLLLQYS